MTYSNIITHAGGSIDGHTYTNSLESIQLNMLDKVIGSGNKGRLCELDCCELKDSYIIAHDGLEQHYGLRLKFGQVSKQECENIKLYGKYTPLFFSDLYDFIQNTKANVYFIIDSKHDLNDYFIQHIIQNMKEHIDRIILQVYNEKDIHIVKKYNMKCLYALWKYNSSAYNEKIKNNLDYIKRNHMDCVGISLFYKYYEGICIDRLISHGYKLYIHGQNDYDKCIQYIKQGFGIFSHEPYKFL